MTVRLAHGCQSLTLKGTAAFRRQWKPSSTVITVRRNAGHPWDGRAGFDILLIDAETQSELERAVEEAERKFWQPWLIGWNEATHKPGGAMYKPCGAAAPWHDSPNKPHPGGLIANGNSPRHE